MREPRIEDLGEDRLLDRIRKRIDPVPAGMLGLGDDAAILPATRRPQLLTTDALVEHAHFRRTWCTPPEVGWKALAVNLSDVAAMGGRPVAAVVSLVLPPATTVRTVLGLYGGLRTLARRTGVAILGGNLAQGSPLSLTLTILGEVPDGPPVLRSGARPGDRLYVSGQPGLARLGYLILDHKREPERTDPWAGPWASILARRKRAASAFPGGGAAVRRFLLPEPRLPWVRDALVFRPSAMMDLSDGLATDLPRLAQASGVRIVIEETVLPVSRAFRLLSEKLGVPAEAAVLQGGEDYEIVLTLPAGTPAPDASLWHAIGRVTSGRGVAVRDAAGRTRPLRMEGFDHFRRR
jgi:thiamine-monophosphate kinase